MRASANLKPTTKAKPFSGLEIVRVHDQNDFRGLGVIPTTRTE